MTSTLLLPLSRRVLRERWKGLIGWILGVVSLIAIQVSVYPTIRDSRKGWSDVTEQFPEAFKKIFRMEDYTSQVGYLTTELFSFMIPLIFIGLATTWAARSASEEEENGTADILMSLPISRSAILLTRLITMMVAVVLSATTGRRGIGLGGGLGIAIAAFVLYSLAPLVSLLQHLLPINPFQWTIGQSPLAKGINPKWAFTTLVVSGCLYGSAFMAFQRRDING